MALSEKARELRTAYIRSWRRKNPEKMRQYNIDYWERKASRYTPEVRAKELHDQGHSQRQISEMLGVSLGAVNAWLNKGRK